MAKKPCKKDYTVNIIFFSFLWLYLIDEMIISGKCDYWYQHTYPNLAFVMNNDRVLDRNSSSTADVIISMILFILVVLMKQQPFKCFFSRNVIADVLKMKGVNNIIGLVCLLVLKGNIFSIFHF